MATRIESMPASAAAPAAITTPDRLPVPEPDHHVGHPVARFRAGQSAEVVHRELAAASRLWQQAQHQVVIRFAEMQRRRLYRELGYPTMRQYAIEALDFSATRATDFVRLADRLEALPRIRAAVASGELGYTKARELIRVASARTEERWLRVARGSSRRELEEKVSRARRKAAARQARGGAGVDGQPELLPAGGERAGGSGSGGLASGGPGSAGPASGGPGPGDSPSTSPAEEPGPAYRDSSRGSEAAPEGGRAGAGAAAPVGRAGPAAPAGSVDPAAEAAQGTDALADEALADEALADDTLTDDLLADIPTQVSMRLTSEQRARYQALWQKLGSAPNAEDLLEALAALVAVRQDARPGRAAPAPQGGAARPGRPGTSGAASDSEAATCGNVIPRGTAPPVQIHAHRCPDCGRMEAAGRRLPAADAEMLACDAAIAAPGKRNHAAIRPQVRREVLARDRHACRTPGCLHTFFLHLHHVVPREHGGANTADNLVTLCTACHRLWHLHGKPSWYTAARREGRGGDARGRLEGPAPEADGGADRGTARGTARGTGRGSTPTPRSLPPPRR